MRVLARHPNDCRVAVFCMADRGHFQRLKPLVSGLLTRGAAVDVFTHRKFVEEVGALGARFVDLFDGADPDEVDTESWPFPVRFASFTGRFAEQIIAAARAHRPTVVLRDTFAVPGQLVARALAIPDVNVCAGHAAVPERMLGMLAVHPRVHVSSICKDYVDVLRAHGLDEASPFSYVTGLSRDLNVYCEPPQFLSASDRPVFEPVVFFGSLTVPVLGAEREHARNQTSFFGPDAATLLKVYVSFGTIILPHRLAEGLQAIAAIVRALAERGDARLVVSLGGLSLSADHLQLLQGAHVRVESYVDQWSILQQADVFVTHHGLNSTHEAIYHGVPMISYPFIWDQPSQAEMCQRLGLAVPLVRRVLGAVTPADASAAFDAIDRARPAMRDAFASARAWELDVIDRRDDVFDRIIALGAPGQPRP